MRKLLKIAAIALSLSYPFLVYWGLQHYDASALLPVLLTLLGLRWAIGAKSADRKIVIATLLGVVAIALVWGHQLGLKFYPVMMNLGFLSLFASSLFFPPPIVERLARIKEPNLSPEAMAYTRKVTWLWSVFFLLNGTIAAITALWATDKTWLLYNGFIAYLLIGSLAAGEWLFRQRVIRG
ncbi:hypothetical protein [Motiliproteus sp. MSK22-1]|uniref:COG4648 family protein n=1 Tax=Motiliproteus sp. MSK22-1 TaxID=1897630 RepID=UPI0009755F02|nr:hypothetical protein [Motiliproteus sp. MSK22-1]OMH31688.1 hypothetical protein BGP75_16310 [Motiliproteus sp. MSK22-1]